MRNRIDVVFLRGLLGVYLIGMVVAVVASIILVARILTVRRARRRAPIASRLLAAALAFLFAGGMAELGAALLEKAAHRLPPLPTSLADGPKDEIDLVVLGGSSAHGQPFAPHLSVGQIVAWKLEEQLGGRKKVRVEMLAQDGRMLVDMYRNLLTLKRRPDAVLIYSGHNEYQARFSWSRTVAADQGVNVVAAEANPWRSQEVPADRPEVIHLPGSSSPLCRMIRGAMAKHFVYSPPPPYPTRSLVDEPVATPAEHASLLAAFEAELEAITAFCDKQGAIPILLIPPANLSRYEPNRSCLPPGTSDAEKREFTAAFLAARTTEVDPTRAAAAYRRLIARQPGFAETHYRLARMLEATGDFAEAYAHDATARDLDGWPNRCDKNFQEAYRKVAARHPRAILIDGPAVVASKSPNGLPGDEMFTDVHHPSLLGHTALAEAVLRGLQGRKSWDLPDSPPFEIDPASCADHFGIGTAEWVAVARKSSDSCRGLAHLRYDPVDRLLKSLSLLAAAERIAGGCPVDEAGVPCLRRTPRPAGPSTAARSQDNPR